MKQKALKQPVSQISKPEFEDENLKLCQSFRIRPPLLSAPEIKINEHFDRFRVKLKEATLGEVRIKIKSIEVESPPQQQKKKETKSKKIHKARRSRHLIQISSDEMEQKQASTNNMKGVGQGKPGSKQDLSAYSLHEIVYLLYCQNLMLRWYYQSFDVNFIIDEKKSFEMLEKQEQEHDFTKTLFTFVDHRILAEILVLSSGSKYCIGDEINRKQEGMATKYYKQLYSKPLIDYMEEWDEFNKIHKRTWMPRSGEILNNIQYFTHLPPAL